MLQSFGYQVVPVSSGAEAIATLRRVHVDLVLLDVQMPVANGFEICTQLKKAPETRLIPVALVTGLNAREHKIRGLQAGADDFIGKPFDPEELQARVASLVRLKQYTDDLDSTEGILRSLALIIEARDQYTDGHCERLSHYAVALGAALGRSAEDLSALDRGGYLHDIGKIGIPDALLLKPSALTREEFELMKQHTVIGDRLCGELRSLRLVREIVRHHHERLDGSGYPDGLRGDEVSVLAQIVSTVDLYDACTSARPVPSGAAAGLRLHRAPGRSRARFAQPGDGRGLHRSRAKRGARRGRVTVTTPTDASVPAEFSICRGGPVYELARLLGLPPGAQGLRRLGLFLGLLAWVPLAGLAFLDGVIHQGATIPFWPSVGTHVRFLLAIPLFFLAEARVRHAGGRRPSPDAPDRVGPATRPARVSRPRCGRRCRLATPG